MNLSHIAEALNLPDEPGFSTISWQGVCTDSRQIQPGDLFVAIRGERFDGHDFVQEACQRGAAAVMTMQQIPGLSVPQIQVADTLQALGTFATYYRKQQPCRVIALTGSNGKTTVKEMIALILPQPALATQGNLNNHIGVPLNILRLQPNHRYAVFELGANHCGEIAYTVAMVQPHVTLINNIAPAHIEGFGSLDNIAQAKGEIYQGLLPEGTAIINADDAYAHFWDAWLTDKKILRFSLQQPLDVYPRELIFNADGCASFILVTPQGEAKVYLSVPGQHNVRNALAAAACAIAAGVSLDDIVRGLQNFTGVQGRMTYRQGKDNALIIDDTYNANLRSVLTALEVLAARDGIRIFVFGDMGELGDWSQQHHEEVGRIAREYGIEKLLTCGRYSAFTAQAFGETAQHYQSQEALAQDLLPYLSAKTTVLVKGSRSASMENIVHQLIK